LERPETLSGCTSLTIRLTLKIVPDSNDDCSHRVSTDTSSLRRTLPPSLIVGLRRNPRHLVICGHMTTTRHMCLPRDSLSPRGNISRHFAIVSHCRRQSLAHKTMSFRASEGCVVATLNVLKAFRHIRTRGTLDLGHCSRRQVGAAFAVSHE
jgi:hypothetical protein